MSNLNQINVLDPVGLEKIKRNKSFLQRLWHLEIDPYPGYMIGYVGPRMEGGQPVLRAPFSTIQGPSGGAVLAMGCNDFFLAMMTHSDELHQLRQSMTVPMIRFVQAQHDLVCEYGAESVSNLHQVLAA